MVDLFQSPAGSGRPSPHTRHGPGAGGLGLSPPPPTPQHAPASASPSRGHWSFIDVLRQNRKFHGPWSPSCAQLVKQNYVHWVSDNPLSGLRFFLRSFWPSSRGVSHDPQQDLFDKTLRLRVFLNNLGGESCGHLSTACVFTTTTLLDLDIIYTSICGLVVRVLS